ncbi:putative flavin monooxygenase, FAD/NAD(P)-binding domain superfamily [Helianthus anomalus]
MVPYIRSRDVFPFWGLTMFDLHSIFFSSNLPNRVNYKFCPLCLHQIADAVLFVKSLQAVSLTFQNLARFIDGTSVYNDRVEVDGCLHLDPNRSIVHSSIYKSLRTNLPRPLMSFSDFSFEDKSYGDLRLFPGHEEVLKFVEDFANEFGVSEVIRINSEVVRVESQGRRKKDSSKVRADQPQVHSPASSNISRLPSGFRNPFWV